MLYISYIYTYVYSSHYSPLFTCQLPFSHLLRLRVRALQRFDSLHQLRFGHGDDFSASSPATEAEARSRRPGRNEGNELDFGAAAGRKKEWELGEWTAWRFPESWGGIPKSSILDFPLYTIRFWGPQFMETPFGFLEDSVPVRPLGCDLLYATGHEQL